MYVHGRLHETWFSLEIGGSRIVRTLYGGGVVNYIDCRYVDKIQCICIRRSDE